MKINPKSLEKLRNLINEEIEYRSGSKLVNFFNQLGFDDIYGPGFPSRSFFTDEKLKVMNDTLDLALCIKQLFAPINFIGRFDALDAAIKDFNQYLAFDKYEIIRQQNEIKIIEKEKVELSNDRPNLESDFLKIEFNEIEIEKLGFDFSVVEVLKFRLLEVEKCLNANAPLSVIFLCGSIIEGILMNMALKYPSYYNRAKSAPLDKHGEVKKFQEWTLNNLIDVSYEIGLLKEDVKKFSHGLREFRNYIHPKEQILSGFYPNEHTSKISWQVLKAAIFQIGEWNHEPF